VTLSAARAFDRQDAPVQAIAAYENAIAAGEYDLAVLLDLVALYFTVLDPGYAAAKGVSGPLRDGGFPRLQELLGLAQAMYGRREEVEFWQLFSRERVLAQEIEPSQYLALIREDFLWPCLPLYVKSGGRDWVDEMTRLIRDADSATARGRLLLSYLPLREFPPRRE